LKVRDVLSLLSANGWRVVRHRGSHRQLQHSTKPSTATVAGEPGDELHPKTLASILRQAQLSQGEG
jgi:predicted RNA binding protein YcfA (HicA-like mRNA interferase family)